MPPVTPDAAAARTCDRTRAELILRLREADFGTHAELFSRYFRREDADAPPLCVTCGALIGSHPDPHAVGGVVSATQAPRHAAVVVGTIVPPATTDAVANENFSAVAVVEPSRIGRRAASVPMGSVSISGAPGEAAVADDEDAVDATADEFLLPDGIVVARREDRLYTRPQGMAFPLCLTMTGAVMIGLLFYFGFAGLLAASPQLVGIPIGIFVLFLIAGVVRPDRWIAIERGRGADGTICARRAWLWSFGAMTVTPVGSRPTARRFARSLEIVLDDGSGAAGEAVAADATTEGRCVLRGELCGTHVRLFDASRGKCQVQRRRWLRLLYGGDLPMDWSYSRRSSAVFSAPESPDNASEASGDEAAVTATGQGEGTVLSTAADSPPARAASAAAAGTSS